MAQETLPEYGTTISVALAGGEIVEVDAVKTTLLTPETGLYRVEWRPKEAKSGGRILYRMRWEGSLAALKKIKKPTAQQLWLLGFVPAK